ncbi:MAG: SDR family NAD(P)-dependent oxidoreductase [Streptosporangiaceae bacterium]
MYNSVLPVRQGVPARPIARSTHAARGRAEFPGTTPLAPIRVIDAFTPHLIGRGAGTIITVTSGIGFLPFPVMPTYAASKAAVHAYSEALRAQLDGTGIDVLRTHPPGRRHQAGGEPAQPPRARPGRLRHRGDGPAPD